MIRLLAALLLLCPLTTHAQDAALIDLGAPSMRAIDTDQRPTVTPLRDLAPSLPVMPTAFAPGADPTEVPAPLTNTEASIILGALYLVLEAALKRVPAQWLRANSPLELAANGALVLLRWLPGVRHLLELLATPAPAQSLTDGVNTGPFRTATPPEKIDGAPFNVRSLLWLTLLPLVLTACTPAERQSILHTAADVRDTCGKELKDDAIVKGSAAAVPALTALARADAADAEAQLAVLVAELGLDAVLCGARITAKDLDADTAALVSASTDPAAVAEAIAAAQRANDNVAKVRAMAVPAK